MYILGICDNADILAVMRIVNVVIMVIQIAVPIVLIIMAMIEFMGAIKVGDQDLLKKAQQSCVRKAIACVLIFLVPTIVTTLVKISAPDSNFTACLDNATLDNINQSYVSRAEELLSKAEENNDYTVYYQALDAVNKISDDATRDSYKDRLDALHKTIKTRIDKTEAENATKPGSGIGGTGENNSVGSGTYKVEYRDGTFYIPNARATSDSHTPRQSGISGTNPEFGRRLEAFIADAKKAGYTITITEGFRPYSTQASYWNSSTRACSERQKWVACPGGSRHGWGIAADLAYNGTGCSSGGWNCNAAAKWAHDNAANYGLKYRLSNEPWHIEPDNISGGNYGACQAPC